METPVHRPTQPIGPSLAERIISALASPTPPTSLEALALAVGTPITTVRPRVSVLLKKGRIQLEQLPWRNAIPLVARTKKSSPLARDLQRIVDQDGKDRVAAARLLHEMESGIAENYAPPMDNDIDGMTDALTRIMQAAGRAVSNAALAQAFALEAHDIEETPAEDMAGHPASRSDLD